MQFFANSSAPQPQIMITENGEGRKRKYQVKTYALRKYEIINSVIYRNAFRFLQAVTTPKKESDKNLQK